MSDDLLKLSGMVISSEPIGEYDRRVVFLTRERGKISAFARGARKPKSTLLAISTPFVFANFYFYEGSKSYTLKHAEVIDYFSNLKQDLEKVCYASYFAEFASYYGKENLREPDALNLLYKAYKALEKETINKRLIKSVFELKLMQINGEYTLSPRTPAGKATTYAWSQVLETPIQGLFQFTLAKNSLDEFEKGVDYLRKHMVDQEFSSLKIMETITKS
ncbi:DNA recombination and repair protein RecO [Lachnospiraceae bacterium TWA4]|nr:DNA recombination and repair protein RecO [Lachnospiraceae bacterium TWA4]